MPKASKKPCSFPGCGTLVEYNERYCAVHKDCARDMAADRNKRYDANRPEVHRFYHSAKWQRIRARYLAQHPLCELCLRHNHIVSAVVVDHKKEIRDGGSMTDFENLQALCAACHNRKTAGERSRRCAVVEGGFKSPERPKPRPVAETRKNAPENP